MGDLLSELDTGEPTTERLTEGATLLRGFAAVEAADLVAALGPIAGGAVVWS